MIQFYETGYGRKFFEVQLPELIKSINRVSDKLEPRVVEGISVLTPSGKITVELSPKDYYPGLWVEVTGADGICRPVACIEYFEDTGIRTLVYTDSNEDDPEAIIPWKKNSFKIYEITISGMPDVDDNLIYKYEAMSKEEALGKFFIDNEGRSFDEIISIKERI